MLGIGEKEMFVASDVAALVRYTRQVVHLDDGELAVRDAPTASAPSRCDARARPPSSRSTVDWEAGDYDAGGYEHFMHKEILEQPAAVERALRGRLDERFDTAHLGGLNLDAARGPGDPPRQDPRLRLGLLRRARSARS